MYCTILEIFDQLIVLGKFNNSKFVQCYQKILTYINYRFYLNHLRTPLSASYIPCYNREQTFEKKSSKLIFSLTVTYFEEVKEFKLAKIRHA